jgi:hypothetical protein
VTYGLPVAPNDHALTLAQSSKKNGAATWAALRAAGCGIACPTPKVSSSNFFSTIFWDV